jgi:Tfp pilus assembly protein PilF
VTGQGNDRHLQEHQGMNEAPAINPQAQMALRQQLGQGFEFLRQGRLEQAVPLSEQLLAAYPGNPEVQYLATEASIAADKIEKAYGHINAAIAAAPGQPQLLLKKAQILMFMRRRADARQTVQEAAAMVGNDSMAYWEIGKFYNKCDDPASAREYYQKALAAGGNNATLLYDLAISQFFLGDFSEAEKNLDAYLARVTQNGYAYYLRSTLRAQTEDNNHVAELRARLQAEFPDASGRAACLYALAKELEDLGRDDESFAALTEAAATKSRTLQFDLAPELAAIEAIRKAYTAEVMQAPTAGHDEEGAIFIVGMPRTGTTLVERMLSRHSDVAAAGELMDFGQALVAATQPRFDAQPGITPAEASLSMDFAALGRDYMASARQAASGGRFFIDKMPVNFIYCGIIRKALPKAKIIHLVRDPMDSCYAVYKTLFSKAYYFSYDLDELADYYASYHRQMRHWHEVMPGQILDVRYEDLVADPEGQARRILAWCGLDWQDAVLAPSENDTPSTTASAAQVREPIHTRSVQKWRRFETGLAPLKARLQAAGVIDD